jgi:hypothetical protein
MPDLRRADAAGLAGAGPIGERGIPHRPVSASRAHALGVAGMLLRTGAASGGLERLRRNRRHLGGGPTRRVCGFAGTACPRLRCCQRRDRPRTRAGCEPPVLPPSRPPRPARPATAAATAWTPAENMQPGVRAQSRCAACRTKKGRRLAFIVVGAIARWPRRPAADDRVPVTTGRRPLSERLLASRAMPRSPEPARRAKHVRIDLERRHPERHCDRHASDDGETQSLPANRQNRPASRQDVSCGGQCLLRGPIPTAAFRTSALTVAGGTGKNPASFRAAVAFPPGRTRPVPRRPGAGGQPVCAPASMTPAARPTTQPLPEQRVRVVASARPEPRYAMDDGDVNAPESCGRGGPNGVTAVSTRTPPRPPG